LRAKATLAFFMPARLATASTQFLRADPLISCRCYGGCPSGSELGGCGCEARNPCPEAPDGCP
jgi:hypothetical protein